MTTLSPLQINTALRIARPLQDVFEAIADPAQMSQYFISNSTGRMEEGVTVEWSFPETDASFPVRITKAEPHTGFVFHWNDLDGSETTVTITLTTVDDNTTFVQITEGEKEINESGLRWLKSNTEGWANFLACLKAWMEYGINLRKGAFYPTQMPA
jgi:uncharacterized protein YndB with AHSA1/START domain